MPRQERSAGFILFRDDPTFPPHGRAFLLLDYGRHWDYAKGHVEPGEDDLAAAHRELAEETGIADARVIEGFAHEIEYYFRKPKHGIVQKKVVFFLARTNATDPDVKISHEHVGHCFVGYDEALHKLTYASAREVLRAAQAFLIETDPVGE